MDAAAVVSLVALIFQYGVPAVSSAIVAYGKPVIIVQDVEALHLLVKKPEEY